MNASGTYFLMATPQEISSCLMNPEILGTFIPKCHNFSGTMADGFTFEIRHKLGPLSLALPAKIIVKERLRGQDFDVSFSGTSVLTGTVTALAKLEMEDRAAGTLMRYEISSEPSRLLTLIGPSQVQRMMQVAIRAFLERLGSRVSA